MAFSSMSLERRVSLPMMTRGWRFDLLMSDGSGRAAKLHCKLAGEVMVRDTANTVCTE